MEPSRWLGHGFGLLALISVAACASPKAAPPPATAADPPSAPAAEASSASSPSAAAPKERAAPGDLACRATTPSEGTTELFLTWDGTAAKGVLRKIAPSGERSAQKVHAERYEGMIVADDPHEKDLTVHAAMVRPIKGKAHMRIGGSGQPWAACE